MKIWKNKILRLCLIGFALMMLCLILQQGIVSLFHVSDQQAKELQSYYDKHNERYKHKESLSASKEDVVGDSRIWSIIRHTKSAILNTYYEKLDSANGVIDNSDADAVYLENQYSRYWHGYVTYLKPLLVLFGMKTVHILNYALVFLLSALFLFYLLKYKQYMLALCFALAFVITRFWYSGLCVEYTGAIFLALILGCVILHIKPEQELKLFMIAGILTCYFDTLVMELFPLLLLMIISILKSEKRKFITDIQQMLVFGISYASMFVFKWLLCLFAGQTWNEIMNHKFLEKFQDERAAVTGTITKIVSCIVPSISTFAAAMALIICCYFISMVCYYLFRAENSDITKARSLYAISILPFVRFVILNGHSYEHFYFVYRVCLITVMVLLLVPMNVIFGGKRR